MPELTETNSRASYYQNCRGTQVCGGQQPRRRQLTNELEGSKSERT